MEGEVLVQFRAKTSLATAEAELQTRTYTVKRYFAWLSAYRGRDYALLSSRHKSTAQMVAELKRDLTEIKLAISGGAVPHRAIHGRTPVQDFDEEKPTNLVHLEIETIRDALEKVGGNRRKAAKLLGIGERTLYRKIKQYGL